MKDEESEEVAFLKRCHILIYDSGLTWKGGGCVLPISERFNLPFSPNAGKFYQGRSKATTRSNKTCGEVGDHSRPSVTTPQKKLRLESCILRNSLSFVPCPRFSSPRVTMFSLAPLSAVRGPRQAKCFIIEHAILMQDSQHIY